MKIHLHPVIEGTSSFSIIVGASLWCGSSSHRLVASRVVLIVRVLAFAGPYSMDWHFLTNPRPIKPTLFLLLSLRII